MRVPGQTAPVRLDPGVPGHQAVIVEVARRLNTDPEIAEQLPLELADHIRTGWLTMTVTVDGGVLLEWEGGDEYLVRGVRGSDVGAMPAVTRPNRPA